jgi:hypothetical protein
MRRLTLLTVAALLAAASSAQAQRGEHYGYSGDIQEYGAPWRYQHRDWSRPGHPHDPGVCWYWDDNTGKWLWEC